MQNTTPSDKALDRLLAKAEKPPVMRPSLAAEIAARARTTPQEAPSRHGAFAAGFALAASLALGIWIGANDTTAQWLPLVGTSATSTADAGFSADDLINGGDVL